MRSFISIILLILLFFVTSCETDVTNVRLPEFDQKLVIIAFLSPSDKTTTIYVTSNRKLYGELTENEPIGTLQGTLSNGTDEVELDTCVYGFILDHNKMRIENGKTYTLKVTSTLGMQAEATCSVPAIKDLSLVADTSITRINPISKLLELRVSFKDIPDEIDFYRLHITDNGNGYRTNEYLETEKQFISDRKIDGNTIIKQVEIPLYTNYDSVLKVKLYHTEESYYLYHKSMANYNGDANPFSESTPVYSNVKGGLGIFTSYSTDSLQIILK